MKERETVFSGWGSRCASVLYCACVGTSSGELVSAVLLCAICLSNYIGQ